MKIKIGYEELWVVVLDGSHSGGKYVELPAAVVERCKRAEEEWEACAELLEDAYLDGPPCERDKDR